MQFFIDSADVGEIKKALALGLCDGVTTNPSLVAKTGRAFEDVLKEIVALVPGPISAEVTATDAEGMLREARELAKFGDQVVIKIPLIVEGLRAVKTLTAEGMKTNVTLCFSAVQALLAAKAGATYVSPFVGRLDDISQDGMAADRRHPRRSTGTTASRRRCSSPPSATRSTCCEAARLGARRRDHPVRRDRAAREAPAHRRRPEEVPRRLGEGAEGREVNVRYGAAGGSAARR